MKIDNSFILYTHPLSANGRKVLAAAYYLNLAPEIKLINVYLGDGQRPEYLAINPFGKIPTLKKGDFILWESNAILQYIAENYGDQLLTVHSSEQKADIARWLFWESSHWQPAISTVLTTVVGHRLLPQLIPAPSSAPHWNEPNFKKNVEYLEQHLKSHPFLVADKLTIADLSIAGMMTYFRYAEFPFHQYPALCKWYETIEALDAWKKSAATLWDPSSQLINEPDCLPISK